MSSRMDHRDINRRFVRGLLIATAAAFALAAVAAAVTVLIARQIKGH